MPEEEVNQAEQIIICRGPDSRPELIDNRSGLVPPIGYSEIAHRLLHPITQSNYVEGPMSAECFAECCNSPTYAFYRTANAENMHQLAVAIAKIDDQNVFRSNDLRLVDNICIEHTRTRRSLFRRWRSSSLEKIKQISKMFLIVTEGGPYSSLTNAYIYIPPKIFHNDDFTSFIVTNPALYMPKDGVEAKVKLIFFPPSFVTDNRMPAANRRTTHWKTSKHFHVSEAGEVCLGTERPLFNSQRDASDIVGMCMTVDSVLSSYDSSDPYIHPHQVSPPQLIKDNEASWQLVIDRDGSSFQIYPREFHYISAERSEVELEAGFKLMLTDQEKNLLNFHGPGAIESLIHLITNGTASFIRFKFLFPLGLSMTEAWKWMGFEHVQEFGEYEYLSSFNPPTVIPSSSDYDQRHLMTHEDFGIQRLERYVDETSVTQSPEWTVRAPEPPPTPHQELQDEQEPESEEQEPEDDEEEGLHRDEDEYEEEHDFDFQDPPDPIQTDVSTPAPW